MKDKRRFIAIGDCNTLGVNDCYKNSFPELVARDLGADVVNCGHTMATTREALRIFQDNFADDVTDVMISFGLTDSWKGFKYSPYVLYYPDNPLRKISRKIVKKFKKLTKAIGLNNIIGIDHVTSPSEYKSNIIKILDGVKGCNVLLLDTLPHIDESRNVDIVKYNGLLDDIAQSQEGVIRVRFYDYFHENRGSLFQDAAHLNSEGCRDLANFILKAYENEVSSVEVQRVR